MAKKQTLTIEQANSIMERELASVRDLVSQFNEKYQNAEFAEADGIREKIDASIKTYNKAARTAFGMEFVAQESPMAWLAERAGIYAVLKVTETTLDDGTPVTSIGTKAEIFNPLSVNPAVWHKLAAKPFGLHLVQGLYYLCTQECAGDLGISANAFKDKYGKWFSMEEFTSDNGTKVPKLQVSNSKLLTALREVVSALIGDDYGKMVINADVRILKACLEKYSRRAVQDSTSTTVTRKITVCKVSDFAKIIVDICNRVVTNGSVDFACKSMKEPKAKK